MLILGSIKLLLRIYEYMTLFQKLCKEKWTELMYTGDEKSPTKSKMYQILDKKCGPRPLEVNAIS